MSIRNPSAPRGRRSGLGACVLAAATVLLLAVAPAARAQELGPALQEVITRYVRPLLADPTLIAAVRAQNAVTAGYDAARIDELDALWKAEIGASEIPTIKPVWDNPVADLLRAQVTESNGLIREMLLMDARGLNVAVSHLTSDYWQGDEDKYLQTYPHGPDAIHVGSVDFDESSQIYMQQLSLSVPDPETGAAIGALTLGLDAEMVQ
ncbi:hypothetical protein PVT71_00445 [Salipiger sp. H15]|uniref:Uncharacterized protein n=1 Tax=Alloyangia sp. H15 TaxID=3029062 RepID=A0AAU8AFI8_9RHOB